MLPLQVYITEYNIEKNICIGTLSAGDKVIVDPFIDGDYVMTDDEYKNGKGFELVGKALLLTEFKVTPMEPGSGCFYSIMVIKSIML